MAKKNESPNNLGINELNSEEGVEKLLEQAEKKTTAKESNDTITIEDENQQTITLGNQSGSSKKVKSNDEDDNADDDDQNIEDEKKDDLNDDENDDSNEEENDDDENENGDSNDDDEVTELELKEDQEEIESSWINAGKELGINVEEESFESFQEALIEKLKQEKAIGIEEGKKVAIVEASKKLGEEEQAFVQMLHDGVPVAELMGITSKYSSILSLSDEQLFRKWYADVKKKTPEQIEALYQKKVADESFNDEVEEFRSRVEEMHNSEIQKVHSSFKEKKDSIIAANASKRKSEEDALETAIRKITTFENQKISDKAINQIVLKMRAGLYRQRFAEDPNYVAQMIIQSEFGSVVTKKLVDKAIKKTQKDSNELVKKKLFNQDQIATKTTNKAGKSSTEAKGTSYTNWGNMLSGPIEVEYGN